MKNNLKNLLLASVLLAIVLVPVWSTAQGIDDELKALQAATEADDHYAKPDPVRDALGKAWNAQDPAQLAEAAGMFQEVQKKGEFKIEALSVDDVLNVALKLAVDKRDAKAIDVIGKIATEIQDKALSDKVAASKKLAGESRNLGAPLTVNVLSMDTVS